MSFVKLLKEAVKEESWLKVAQALALISDEEVEKVSESKVELEAPVMICEGSLEPTIEDVPLEKEPKKKRGRKKKSKLILPEKDQVIDIDLERDNTKERNFGRKTEFNVGKNKFKDTAANIQTEGIFDGKKKIIDENAYITKRVIETRPAPKRYRITCVAGNHKVEIDEFELSLIKGESAGYKCNDCITGRRPKNALSVELI